MKVVVCRPAQPVCRVKALRGEEVAAVDQWELDALERVGKAWKRY